MPQETQLEPITVTGQRRTSFALPFPVMPLPAAWTSPEVVRVEGQTGPVVAPCQILAFRSKWNADAAAAGAVPDFLDAAESIGFADAPGGIPNLLNREFGSSLYRGPQRTIVTGVVSWGSPVDRTDPNYVSSLTINTTGVTSANYLGDIHSHPNGNPLPSNIDWNFFIANNNLARDYGRALETFYMYIVAVDPISGSLTTYVYEDGPRAVGSPDPARPITVGAEVNPDAQPC